MNQFVFRPFQFEAIAYDPLNYVVPNPRWGHRIVCNDNYIYCIGGCNTRFGIINELWKFNRHTLKWIAITATNNMPKELAWKAVCLLEGEILMIFGGPRGPLFDERRWDELSVCFLNRIPLQFDGLKTIGKKPSQSHGQTMVIHNNHLYTIGASTSHVHKLDLKTLKWESVYETKGGCCFTQARYEHGIAYDGNFIYVLGGGTLSGSYDLDELPRFDLNKNIWKLIKTQPDELQLRYPAPRSGHSCIQYKEGDETFVVIAGGLNNQLELHYVDLYDDIWRLSLKSYKWSLIRTSTLPKPLFSHGFTTSGDGCMYVFGGITVNEVSEETINDMYKIWLKIPKLSAISWEAVLYYYPNLKILDHKKLLQLGIPSKYVTALQM